MSAELKPQPLIGQTEIKPVSWWDALEKKLTTWQEELTIYQKKRMVSWYNPLQLARTGRDVFISTIIGRHADRRLVAALTAEEALVFDYRGRFDQVKLKNCNWKGKGESDWESRDAIWIDYVADVGDGWNSTYGVAYWLAQDQLRFKDEKGVEHSTQRGEVLIFGGDQVYPVASREEYCHRLVKPYRAALEPKLDAIPHLYATPGNHDWYDSLAAFTTLFCDEKTQNFAGREPDPFRTEEEDDRGWKVPQNRSYFALRLPGRWWLIGIDLQLSSDLDPIQIQYFEKVAEQMEEGDRVILCSPEPYWVYQIAYGENDRNKDSRLNQQYLEKHIFKSDKGKKKIKLYLAGDLHHYFHLQHEGIDKITAGGGGAFMHPTHGEFGESFDETLEEQGGQVLKRFPAMEDSKRRAWINLLFPFINPLFGLVTALLYWLTAWSVMGGIPRDKSIVERWDWAGAFDHTSRSLVETPVGLPWILAIVVGFWLFTDTSSRLYRFVGGFAHGFTHLAMVFCVGWIAYWYDPWVISIGTPRSQILIWGLLVMLGGYLVGGFVMGVYLFISINVFGRHSTEALSSLRTQDWKNFLRIKIDKEGRLTIYPIGIRHVPRKWRDRRPGEDSVSKYQPEGRFTKPELIEPPIIIYPAKQPSQAKEVAAHVS